MTELDVYKCYGLICYDEFGEVNHYKIIRSVNDRKACNTVLEDEIPYIDHCAGWRLFDGLKEIHPIDTDYR